MKILITRLWKPHIKINYYCICKNHLIYNQLSLKKSRILTLWLVLINQIYINKNRSWLINVYEKENHWLVEVVGFLIISEIILSWFSGLINGYGPLEMAVGTNVLMCLFLIGYPCPSQLAYKLHVICQFCVNWKWSVSILCMDEKVIHIQLLFMVITSLSSVHNSTLSLYLWSKVVCFVL